MSNTELLPAFLAAKFREWKNNDFLRTQDQYLELAAKGQSPKVMVIGCCDSRIQLSSLFSAKPGELFIHRNIANLVPKCSPDTSHHGTSAAIQYAVEVLKVNHIIILGHSDCGGVKACNEMCSSDDGINNSESFIENWLGILGEEFHRVRNISDTPARIRALEFINVVTSLENLQTYPFVSEALQMGDLKLYGLWQNISEGQLLAYDATQKQFSEVF